MVGVPTSWFSTPLRLSVSGLIITGLRPTADRDFIHRPCAAPTHMTEEGAAAEIRVIRTFVSRYNAGVKGEFGSETLPEARPISIVICESRWHTSKSLFTFRNCLRLSIASKLSWGQGWAVTGIHVMAGSDDRIGDFSDWSSGQVLRPSENAAIGTWLNTKYVKRLDLTDPYELRQIIRATLRDIREPARPIIKPTAKTREYAVLLRRWRSLLTQRAEIKYGYDSPQVRLIRMVSRDDPSLEKDKAAKATALDKGAQGSHEDLEGAAVEVGPTFRKTRAFCDAQGLPDYKTIINLGSELWYTPFST